MASLWVYRISPRRLFSVTCLFLLPVYAFFTWQFVSEENRRIRQTVFWNMKSSRLIDVDNTFLIKQCNTLRLLVGAFSKKDPPILRWICTPLYIFLQVNGVILALALMIDTTSLYDFFARLGNLASFTTVAGMYFFFLIRERKITLLCLQLAEQWILYRSKVYHTSGIRIIEQCEKIMKLIFYILIIGSLSTFVAYTSYPILHYYLLPIEGQLHYDFPLKIYFPFESSISHGIAYIVMCAVVLYCAILIATMESLYLCLFCTLEAAFRLNGQFFERFCGDGWRRSTQTFPQTSESDVIRRWNIARYIMCVNEHQKLYRIAEEFKSLIRETLLILYAGTTVVAAFGPLLIMMDPERYGYCITISILPWVHITAVFFMASNVTFACEETANILYTQHMEHMELLKNGSFMDAKVFLFMLMRAQKPVVFDAGWLCKLTLRNFLKFVERIYSFIMVLRTFQETNM